MEKITHEKVNDKGSVNGTISCINRVVKFN